MEWKWGEAEDGSEDERVPTCDYSLRWMFICPLENHCEEDGFFEAEGLARHLRGEEY